MLYVVLGFVLAMAMQIREHRLIMDHQYYWGRTLNALPDYADVSKNPLKPLAALPHLADGVLRTTSDIVRLIQEDPRPIKPLTERGRFMDSAIGAAQDGLGAVGDLARLKPVSAVGKAAGAVLAVGDAAVGLVADGADLLTGADTDRETHYALGA